MRADRLPVRERVLGPEHPDTPVHLPPARRLYRADGDRAGARDQFAAPARQSAGCSASSTPPPRPRAASSSTGPGKAEAGYRVGQVCHPASGMRDKDAARELRAGRQVACPAARAWTRARRRRACCSHRAAVSRLCRASCTAIEASGIWATSRSAFPVTATPASAVYPVTCAMAGRGRPA